jgi:hypothetical protein
LYMGWGIWTPNMSCIWTEITNICREFDLIKIQIPRVCPGGVKVSIWFDRAEGGGCCNQGSNFIAAIAAIAVEREQNAVDHCGNDGNFLPYSAIFILFRCWSNHA